MVTLALNLNGILTEAPMAYAAVSELGIDYQRKLIQTRVSLYLTAEDAVNKLSPFSSFVILAGNVEKDKRVQLNYADVINDPHTACLTFIKESGVRKFRNKEIDFTNATLETL